MTPTQQRINVILNALAEYGTKGIEGLEDNQIIVNYFRKIGYKWVDDDETPWCAAFLNYILLKSGLTGTNKLNARSFLQIGKETKTPTSGDVVILWRINKNGPFGHCGLFIKETKNTIYILGGNQSNEVNITEYSKSQLLGYRNIFDK